MLIVMTRAIIIYFFLLLAMRLMGKKQLSELQPFEFAITLIVAELACIPMSDTQVPVIYGLVPIFTLFVVSFILTKAVKHSIRLRRVINGKPVIVITPRGIDYQAISRLDLTVHDLLEAIRGCNYVSPAQLLYAIVETNGDLSVIPKPEYASLTPADIGVHPKPSELPYGIVCEGKRLCNNLKPCKMSDDDVDAILNRHNLSQKQVLLLSVCPNGDYYLQPISQDCIQGNYKEEAK